ncbi:MAG TPA: HDIG domain-containing protein [Chloroflexaceae bacterium]|nr:HDIG domain-containing protein [Chloroflexaceae bacterium]
MSDTPSPGMGPALAALLADLAAFLGARGVAAWLVGGAARDLALGRSPTDLDVAVAGDGFALARAYADARGAAFVPLDAARATGRVVIAGAPPLTLDLAGLRGPTIEADLRLRDFTVNALAVALTGEDQRPRTKDQSSAVSSARPSAFLDPTGGLADLRAGVLRACGPTSPRDDPLRVLRAARLCAGLGLRPDPGLAPLMREAAPGLAGVAPERARDELLKLLDAPSAAPWLRYLDDCGALTRLIPELEPARDCDQPNVHFLPVLAHILETVTALDWLIAAARRGGPGAAAEAPLAREGLPVAVQTYPGLSDELPFADRLAALLGERRAGGHRRAALLKLAALLHDVAKPQTKEVHPDGKVSFYDHQTIGAEVAARVARRLRMSRQDGAYVALVVREHMRPGQLRTSEVVTPRAVVRLFRDLGDAGPDVLLHELADHLATRGPNLDPGGWAAHLEWVGALLEVHYAPAPERRAPLIDGHGLMEALGIGPGPRVGALLRAIGEAQAAGEITTREQALELARQLLAEQD